MTFSAQVLKLINSGFYGFSSPVKSISHATVLLGFSAMKTLVMSTSMVGMLSRSFEGLWNHCLACARACSSLAQIMAMDDPEEISVVGLLHDIGKVVVQQYMKSEFEAIMSVVKNDDVLMLDAERTVFEVTHADIARWLLEKWNLPADVVEPIANHHSFDRELKFAERTAIVHLADILVRAAGCGSGGDSRIPGVNHEALVLLHIEEKNLHGIMGEVLVELYEFM